MITDYYRLKYPSVIPPERLYHLLQEGEILEDVEGNKWRVDQVVPSISGPPRIVLQEEKKEKE